MIPALKQAASAILAAIGFAGGCEARQGDRSLDLPPENISAQSCAARDCLIIEPGAQYCSIDPQSISEGALFATKSTLSFAGGAFALENGRNGLLPAGEEGGNGLRPVLTSAHGQMVIAPPGGFDYSIHRDDIVSDLGPWVEVETAFSDDMIRAGSFFLRTSRWPHDHFHLGDPASMRWFFEAARNLFVQVGEGGSIFPGLVGAHIPFAPCDMHGLPDQPFVFEFENGERLTLTARVINGSNLVGFYFGRLMSAHGRHDGETLDITDRDRLAFFGSTRSWAEMMIPGLAVRTGRRGEVCGIILDPSEWDTDRAVNGYVAYEMSCDERRGRRLDLVSVEYPQVFSLP